MSNNKEKKSKEIENVEPEENSEENEKIISQEELEEDIFIDVQEEGSTEEIEENGQDFQSILKMEIQNKLEVSKENPNLVPVQRILPPQLGLIAVYHRPLFPHMIIPLVIEGDLYQSAVLAATKVNPSYIGIVLAKNTFDARNPKIKELYSYGVVARIAKILSQNNHSTQILLDVIGRIRIKKSLGVKPFMMADVEHIEEPKKMITDDIRAFCREILSNMKELVKLNALIKEELSQFISQINIEDPSRLADFAATLTTAEKEQLQEVLEARDIMTRLEKTLFLIKQELDLSRLQAKISRQIEDRISNNQREFFLKEQLKEIHKELGISKDEKSQEIEKFEKRIEKLKLSEAALERYQEEMDKLSLLDIQSPEFNISRNYLDWLTILPWGKHKRENQNLEKAEKILNADHYGLEDIKERIIEFIAIIKLKKQIAGTILCFVGPPGVGKTSIGKSIAKALNRPFFRFSVGGMRDEAEIKGHRRTYIGAMPGKFIQALKTTQYSNPVIMLDEIDKIGSSYQGDPASALLEVLDPEQNQMFTDHYLDIPFDLSKVVFIATANQLDTIPSPLLDRMEVMRLSGYITREKQEIAKKYLVPKQRKKHGLKSKNLSMTDSSIVKIIDGYAREAGVRNLEKYIEKICRKVATEIAKGKKQKSFKIGIKEVETYLKSPVFEKDEIIGKGKPGVVTGLAWTSMGGAILSIEAIKMKSEQKGFKQSGQLGKVMIESSGIAYSFVLGNAQKFGGKSKFFKDHFIHLHVPAGATPKDGPSAGITMATSLISLMNEKPPITGLGMTGELTLSGEVLPIGGLKEKVIAARRVGLKILVVPKANKKDYDELPDHLREDLTIHFAEYFEDVYKIAFGS